MATLRNLTTDDDRAHGQAVYEYRGWTITKYAFRGEMTRWVVTQPDGTDVHAHAWRRMRGARAYIDSQEAGFRRIEDDL